MANKKKYRKPKESVQTKNNSFKKYVKFKTTNFDFNTKLVFLTITFLFIFKLFFIKDISILTSTFIFESCLFLLILLLFSFKNILSRILFFIFYISNFIISLVNTYFLQDIIFRRYSLYNLDPELVIFFFKDLLPTSLILIFIITILLLFTCSYYFKIKITTFHLKLSKKYLFVFQFLLLLLIIYLIPVLFTNFSHPTINTVEDMLFSSKDSLKLYDESEINNLITKDQISQLNKELNDYPKHKIKYDYIFLFVGETVLESKFAPVLYSDTNNFFSENINDSLYYENYFANNQDSRTAIMSMLSSIFIPYESYVDNWYNLYSNRVVSRHNLVDYFNSNDYNTIFAISSIETPIVGKEYNWSQNINISDLNEYNNFKEEYVCLKLGKFQTGCEDITILPKIKNIVNTSKKAFVLQEFIYGHSVDYLDKKNETNIEYYSNYLSEFYNYLEEKDILDESLIIFVGDHGSKAYEAMKEKNTYRIPLIFINKNISAGTKNNLYSHLDFKEVLFNNMLLNYNKTINNDFTYIIGGTSSSFLGYLDSNSFILFDTSNNSVVRNTKNATKINYKYNLFYSYKKYFEKL